MPTRPSTYRRRPRVVADRRPSAAARGYSYRWRQASKAYLREHPLCVECLKGGDLKPAVIVDHIVPHRGDEELFWDETNWQGLCKRHHDVKTATEDGGFGRSRRGDHGNAPTQASGSTGPGQRAR